MKAYKINSEHTRRALQRQALKFEGKALNSNQQNIVVNTLEALAESNNDIREVFLRYGHDIDNIIVDLAQPGEDVVEITAQGWSVLSSHPAPMQRLDGMLALPTPVPGGSLDEFRDLMQLPEDVWHKILAFLIGSINPRGPYMILMLEGEHGSGKTLLCNFIRNLIDPYSARSVSLPRDVRDLMIHASSNWLLSFDNMSGIGRDISDTICRLATDGGFATRKLYTNDEMTVFQCQRPMMMNGITAYATQPDLRDRAIFVTLPSLPPENRRTERELKTAFEEMLPRLLGALYDAASAAIRNLPTTTPPQDIRMMDFARWVQAAEGYLGLPEGTLVGAIHRSQAEKSEEALATDEVYRALIIWLVDPHAKHRAVQEKTATMGELYGEIKDSLSSGGLRYLSTSKQLSDYLKRHRKEWAKHGLHVEEGPKVRAGRLVTIRLDVMPDEQEIESLKAGSLPQV